MPLELDALNRALKRKGQNIVISRRTGTTDSFISIGCLASVRQYDPHEVTGSIVVGDTKVIVSPSAFTGVAWSGGVWPKKGDQVRLNGRTARIEATYPIYVGDALVRIELQVRG